MTSSWISVESTSMTTSRPPRRASPAGATAMSAPVTADTVARSARRPARSAPETSSSTVVTGQRDRRRMRSMLAPCVGDRPGHGRDVPRLERGAHDDDGRPAGAPRGVVAVAAVEADAHPHRLAGPGQPVGEDVLVLGRAEQHRQGEVPADDDLLEVEHLGADGGGGLEDGLGHAGAVGTVEGDEEGALVGVRQRGQRRVARGLGHPRRLTERGRPATRRGRGSDRGRSAGPLSPTVNRRVPTAWSSSAPRGVVGDVLGEAPRLGGDAGGALDLVRVAADPGAPLVEDGVLVGDGVGLAEAVPDVGLLGDDPQRLLLAAAADEDRDRRASAPG